MPVDQRLGLDIKRAEQRLMSAKSNALRELGLSVAAYAALLAIDRTPGISAAGLARACLVTPQAINSVLKTLTERGLVERAPHPWLRHATETTLTDQGRTVLAEADRRAVAVERRLSEAFTPDERETLRRLLAKAADAL
ncbi:MarR family winged helix-turn-helix transcriptional regulator [Glycomyces salinus]|uniref:MarR family winged helix-turn-helix transcriptional regulator n=1 Tax=Glycomyces salinus TaxID=980294 RepID=UPI001E449BBC|nr:MarR family transcriptional regulator [Glycomyces salinus]